MTRQVLAGDIGGTNARLAIVSVDGPAKARIVHEARYPSSTAPGLAPLVTRYLEEFGRVSSERVLSGAGIAHIYRVLKSAGVAEEQGAVRDEMAGNDPAPVITRHGLAGTDPLSAKTLEVFAGAYGAAAGNLALTVLASGGVYIAGGIAPKIFRRLTSGAFMEAFRNKGRLSSVVARMPVRVILTEDVALYGAAAVAARTLTD